MASLLDIFFFFIFKFNRERQAQFILPDLEYLQNGNNELFFFLDWWTQISIEFSAVSLDAKLTEIFNFQ